MNAHIPETDQGAEPFVYGAHEVSIDDKNRILLPKEVRKFWNLAEGSKIKITIRPDRCLMLMLPETWERDIRQFRHERSITPARRRYIEGYISYTREEVVDSSNRVMLASTLRNYARIQFQAGEKKELRMKGFFDRFLLMNDEIWSRQETDLALDGQNNSWQNDQLFPADE